MTDFAAFTAPGRFLKGNIHTHTNRSDGRLPPDEVVARYRAAGYDFLSITDHFLPSYGFPITDAGPVDGLTLILGAELHAPRTEMSELWHLVAVGLPADFAPTSEGEDGPALARRARSSPARERGRRTTSVSRRLEKRSPRFSSSSRSEEKL